METEAKPRSEGSGNGEPALARLEARFQAGVDPFSILHERTAIVEQEIRAAYEAHLAPVAARGLALIAVGGFGRRELFPYSDVDLVVLVDRPSGTLRDGLGVFLTSLWDAGLRMSQSVRTPKECGELHEGNLEFSLSLLDQRPVAGDSDLCRELAGRVAGFLRRRRQELIDHLCRLARQRHLRYQETIQHLEPNVKEAPGGLRDLNLIGWLQRLGGDDLFGSGWGVPLEPAHRFLAVVRCFLHFRARRDDNVLSFDAQEEIARQLFDGGQAPEAWMRQYYRHAREVFGAARRAIEAGHGRSSSLLAAFRQWRTRLSNAEFTVVGDLVWLRWPQQLAHEPASALRLFAFLARHNLRPAPETERRIRQALPEIELHFSRNGPHWQALIELLALPHASAALRRMNEIGLLGAVLPEWRRIECLAMRDFHHRYTVDEHSLHAIQALEELARAEAGARAALAGLAGRIEHAGLLRLALLLHDVGKADARNNHIPHSLELAEAAMERIQLPLLERELVRFLIARHLDLSAALTARDPDDPATRRTLAASIGAVERLEQLVLLTYADVSAVHPSAMTDWRCELLWRLYLAVRRELAREVATERIGAGSSTDPERSEFLEGLPRRYLFTHSDAQIAAHIALARHCQAGSAAVRLARCHDVFEATVVAHDRPFLFASLAGTLAAFGMNILRGEAYTNRHGLAVDTFFFEDPARTLEVNPSESERLAWKLERAATGRLNVADLLRGRRSRPARREGVPSELRIDFDQEASEAATLIEIAAPDRMGLLFDLAQAISGAGCQIDVVLIDTRAHQAFDVFYVTHRGAKLPPSLVEALQRSLRRAATGVESGS